MARVVTSGLIISETFNIFDQSRKLFTSKKNYPYSYENNSKHGISSTDIHPGQSIVTFCFGFSKPVSESLSQPDIKEHKPSDN